MNSKGNKGITLIALIITIIILLILAGVTINMVLGNDGIIAKAQATNQKQIEAALIEEIKMYEAEKEVAKYGETQARGQDVFIADLYEKKLITKEQKEKLENGEDIIIKQDDKEYIIKGLSGTTPVVPEETPEITNSNIASYTTDRVPIPKGFTYVEGTKDEGVVIRNTTDGNEFVWVPVEGELELIDWGDQELGTEGAEYLEEMKISVNSNGGFYVGRYETGKDASGKVVSQKGAEVYLVNKNNKETFDMLYNAQKSLYAYEDEQVGVASGMIWGSQWDAIMKWIENDKSTNQYITNSENIGNYWKWIKCEECAGDEYVDCYDCGGNGICTTCNGEDSGNCATCDGTADCQGCSGCGDLECGECSDFDSVGEIAVINHIKTGTEPKYKVKNIYDIAGNYRRNN